MRRTSAVAIFWGSFLSFGVQPLAGRTLLPHFGGSGTVWVTCLCAFQVLLLAGYWYAFVPAAATRQRAGIHLLAVALAGMAMAMFGLRGEVVLNALAGLDPRTGVLAGVVASVGMAAVVLSANSTVVQAWSGGGRDVYRLYAVGNAGSFVGLLAYPLLVEPFVALRWQWIGFAVGAWVYAALLWLVWRERKRTTDGKGSGPSAASVGEGCRKEVRRHVDWWLWVAVPMATSGLLTAATTHLTSDFTPMPLLWALLLGAFLLSWVVGFSRMGERYLPVLAAAGALALLAAGIAMFPRGVPMRRFYWSLGAAFGTLFFTCGALHGWLFRTRPEAGMLHMYYLCIAVGGAAGGLLCGVAAPLAFNSIAEYPLALAAAAGLLAALLAGLEDGAATAWVKKAGYCVMACAAVCAFVARVGEREVIGRVVQSERGVHGVVSVREITVRNAAGKEHRERWLYNGTTAHGFQVLVEDQERTPTMYYNLSGGGIAFKSHPAYTNGTPMRVGMVGMGVGTLAAYGRQGDLYRFWEISPEVIGVATNDSYFTFVSRSKAKVEVVEADGRLALERERRAGEPRYDVLVIDAFTGDSVPTHLVTEEAFRLYMDRLEDDGILALHVSNWHIDLWPTMKAAATRLGLFEVGTYSPAVPGEFAAETGWVFMSRRPFESVMPNCCHEVDWEKVRDVPLITDGRGSLLFDIRFGVMPPFKEREFHLFD